MSGETWLVCGGRNFNSEMKFETAMEMIVKERGLPVKLVHGGAHGADSLADLWALRREVCVVRVLPEWDRYGRKAGPLRNALMLDRHHPDLVIAFPGGRGTAHMVSIAKKADVPVRHVL